MTRPPPRSTLFPYTTLFRSALTAAGEDLSCLAGKRGIVTPHRKEFEVLSGTTLPTRHDRDRKSTRLNSSHLGISYAVFCLKKKNNNNKYIRTRKHICHSVHN